MRVLVEKPMNVKAKYMSLVANKLVHVAWPRSIFTYAGEGGSPQVTGELTSGACTSF